MVGIRLVRSAEPLEKELIRRFCENEIPELQDDINLCLQEGHGCEGLPTPELLNELRRTK